jgi:ADP-heptose:LPS heptosyltransferase
LVPKIFPSPEDRAAAETARKELELHDGKKVLACSITTRQPGAWPRSHFLRVLEIVSEQQAVDIVLFGAATDAAILQEAKASCRAPCKLLVGTLNLRALAAFIQKCSAAIVMDSGPRHIANAVSTPLVFGRNLIFSRVEAGRYCENEIDCGPHDEYVPPAEVERVIMTVDPAATAQLVIDALGRSEISS